MMKIMENLVEQFEALVGKGDEVAVRKFAIDHFAEFPPEVQQKLAVELLDEALEHESVRDLKQRVATEIGSLEGE